MLFPLGYVWLGAFSGGWKKKRVENRKENEWEGVWLKGEGERKVVGPTSFLSPAPFKIQSLQIGVKSEKNI